MHFCQGITKKGRPCNRKSKNNKINEYYCALHSTLPLAPAPNTGFFQLLPKEIFQEEIIPKLDYKSILALSQVSKDLNRIFATTLRNTISIPSTLWQVFLRDMDILTNMHQNQVFSYVYLCYSFPWCTICFTYSNLQDRLTFEFNETVKKYSQIQLTSSKHAVISEIKLHLQQYFFDKLTKSRELTEYTFTPNTRILLLTNITSVYDKYVNLSYPPILSKSKRLVSNIIFFS